MENPIESIRCPLCDSQKYISNTYGPPGYRKSALKGLPKTFLYHDCQSCRLTWLDRDHWLQQEAEKAHYDRHNNDPEDPRYRDFLNKLWQPLKVKLADGGRGLDFGSGPGPTLHRMAIEDGFMCDHYDPIYQPDMSELVQQYHFITCSEVVEHLHDPAAVFKRLSAWLKPGGWLGLMTSRPTTKTNFANWHYRHDPTHVCFYRDATCRYIADTFGFDSCEFASPSVALMRKASGKNKF